MGWGTQFNYDVYLSKDTFGTIYDIESTIKECEEDIETSRSQLFLATGFRHNAEPVLVSELDRSNIIDELADLYEHVEYLMDIIAEKSARLAKLYMLLDYCTETKVSPHTLDTNYKKS